MPDYFLTIFGIAKLAGGFVVAMAARENLAAARSSGFTSSLVMLASILMFFSVFCSRRRSRRILYFFHGLPSVLGRGNPEIRRTGGTIRIETH
uniref:Uncharacterized protein n=1 Tax=Rhizophora mucronata TaxID=61149 RepID=A0A2P2J7T8_RHIMU